MTTATTLEALGGVQDEPPFLHERAGIFCLQSHPGAVSRKSGEAKARTARQATATRLLAATTLAREVVPRLPASPGRDKISRLRVLHD